MTSGARAKSQLSSRRATLILIEGFQLNIEQTETASQFGKEFRCVAWKRRQRCTRYVRQASHMPGLPRFRHRNNRVVVYGLNDLRTVKITDGMGNPDRLVFQFQDFQPRLLDWRS